MAKMSLRHVDVAGKHVFVRVDFNVPLEAGVITDDTRIRAALPTIQFLLEHGAAVILASHLGRPKGRVAEPYRLAPVAQRLEELIGRPVAMAPDCVGPDVERMIAELRPGELLLLENLRFHAEEEANDPAFARSLARGSNVYVDDAFGSAHRAHASTEGITHFLPSVGGLLMQRELDELGRVLTAPDRPLLAIIGGAKVSSKIGVLQNLLTVADQFVIGGGMANTFLKAQGYDVGSSLVEADAVEVARQFLVEASARERRVYLPVDAVIAREMSGNSETRTVDISDIPLDWAVFDIGPRSVEAFSEPIAAARTIVWNGPMGVFEVAEFAEGTRAVARAVAASMARTVVGGGDSIAAVEQLGLSAEMGHISTGGGASLEFLEGRTLPGVAALQDTDEEEGH